MSKVKDRYMELQQERDRLAHECECNEATFTARTEEFRRINRLLEQARQEVLAESGAEEPEHDLVIGGRYYKFKTDDPNEEEIEEVEWRSVRKGTPVSPGPPPPPTAEAVDNLSVSNANRYFAVGPGRRKDTVVAAFFRAMLGAALASNRPADTRRATGVLDVLSKIVPKRIAQEEIGDAIEVINTSNLKRWQMWLKVAVTIFFVLVNTLREVMSAALGKKKGGT